MVLILYNYWVQETQLFYPEDYFANASNNIDLENFKQTKEII